MSKALQVERVYVCSRRDKVPSTIRGSYPWTRKTSRQSPLSERNAETFTNGRPRSRSSFRERRLGLAMGSFRQKEESQKAHLRTVNIILSAYVVTSHRFDLNDSDIGLGYRQISYGYCVTASVRAASKLRSAALVSIKRGKF
jgi:hypothetical protein